MFRRVTKAALAVLFVVFLAAACSSDGFPTSYTDQVNPETNIPLVQANWMAGCEVSLAENLAENANQVCECSFERLSAPGGIPFEEFVRLNDELKNDPASLVNIDGADAARDSLLEIVKNCIAP